MKFRWTEKELKENSDDEIIRGVLSERMSGLNVYSPLYVRLRQIYIKTEKRILAKRNKR